jgi:putative transposase
VIDVVEEIAQRCRIENVSTPSRPSIDRRLHRLTPALVVRRKVEDDRQTSTAAGTFVVRKPFDVVQIDHTKCDLFVVDDLYRTSIGRPWLSVAMDVATRVVIAILVTFEPPSAGDGCAIDHAHRQCKIGLAYIPWLDYRLADGRPSA